MKRKDSGFIVFGIIYNKCEKYACMSHYVYALEFEL